MVKYCIDSHNQSKFTNTARVGALRGDEARWRFGGSAGLSRSTMPRLLTGSLQAPRMYRNLPVPGWFHESTSTALQTMELRPTDVVLSSWPKSGTHWVYRALRLLTMVGPPPEPPMVLAEMLKSGPGDHFCGGPASPDDSFAALLEREAALGSARLIVSHATPELLPSFEAAGKLVYVARDPRDVVTSNYFFMGAPKHGWVRVRVRVGVSLSVSVSVSVSVGVGARAS